MQHVHDGDPHLTYVCCPLLCRNSEIYNHEDVQQQYLSGVSMVRDSKSDSAKPGHLYEKYGDDDKIWNALDGTFAWFASEMKALQHQCVSFEIFPPVREVITATCPNCICQNLFCLSAYYAIAKVSTRTCAQLSGDYCSNDAAVPLHVSMKCTMQSAAQLRPQISMETASSYIQWL